jgi:hypothetical protein
MNWKKLLLVIMETHTRKTLFRLIQILMPLKETHILPLRQAILFWMKDVAIKAEGDW